MEDPNAIVRATERDADPRSAVRDGGCPPHEATRPLAWPPHRTVASMPGSLPMGGFIPATPIHAFETPAPQLALKPGRTPAPTRRDIELGGLLAFEIRNLLAAEEADAIVEASERFGYRDEAPGIQTAPGMRINKSVHWVADLGMMGPLFDRMAALLPPQIDGWRLHARLSERLNMYRYDDGDVFNRHTDGDWPGFGLSDDRRTIVQWPELRSFLTMLLYLNGESDGVRGGATLLFRPDGSTQAVRPAKGSALFFRHGFGPESVLHLGSPVYGPVSKYVARINVLYAP